MQIVIDIDEDYVKIIHKNGASNYPEEVIKNGIPLPKGHGRLVDADTLWDLYHDNDYDFYEALDDVQTIIEAEREE